MGERQTYAETAVVGFVTATIVSPRAQAGRRRRACRLSEMFVARRRFSGNGVVHDPFELVEFDGRADSDQDVSDADRGVG
jgi:hypothetical protein